MSTDEARRRLMSGEAWEEFCDTIKAAGKTITAQNAPFDPLDRAEGFRYLSRITRAALEAFIEYADPLAPVLFRPVHETAKMGADNPDFYYQWASVSGRHEYRITGRRGSAHYLGLGSYAGQYGGGSSRKTGYIEGRDIRLAPDGSFEIAVGGRERESNWLPLEPDSSSLIVRQMILDSSREQVADLKIERVDGEGGPVPLTPESLEDGLGKAGRLVLGAAAMFAGWTESFKQQPNQLPEFDQDAALAAHGDPNIRYYHGYWELQENQALLVEAKPPECQYWNFQINNYWMESLDYRYHTIAVNKHSASYRPDGSVRLVVAGLDPGVDNWLDTAGHSRGTMCFRWVRAAEHPQPQTRVVELSELAGERTP